MNAAERIQRGRSVRKHVIVALLVLLCLIPINFIVTPKHPWWMWVLTAWLPLIAGHAAWSMGLFERAKDKEH